MIKKAQIDIITFIGQVIGLILLGVFLMYIINTIGGGFSNAINSTSTEAAKSVTAIYIPLVNWMDTLIIIGFIINLVLLFVFAFIIDTNHLFLVFYILSVIFTMIFAPYVVEPVESIFDMPTLSAEVAKLPMTSFILTRFNIILLAIIIVTGIILYAKFRGGNQYQR